MTTTQATTVRVTCLYPLPMSQFADEFLEAKAEQYGGSLVGSGADVERDLCFDFPSHPHVFIDVAESCGCHVEVAALDD